MVWNGNVDWAKRPHYLIIHGMFGKQSYYELQSNHFPIEQKK